MARPVSPYLVPGFYDKALAEGRHRDIVGGRWDETGRVQMAVLKEAGLLPHHHLLDIGAGSMRLGCKAVPYLEPGHYWATDASLALMQRGRELELSDPARLSPDHLIEDHDFSFPGVPQTIDFAIAFGVFTHLPLGHLQTALTNLPARCPQLIALLFTVFLAPENQSGAYRQTDGVVTHPDRAPWHFRQSDVLGTASNCGWLIEQTPALLPRGQALFTAKIRC
ncbi:class I SAM-dependent methyltransferase [Thioclava sp. FR2]|uniref:class I SAM-dependent methyltransferase n=1 Tax=Thioclava sp. FR2 TaxID=3445780 RepID=UPI003EBCB8B1